MTDTSEQLGGPTQPVLRTMREKLWIDPEVVARVQLLTESGERLNLSHVGLRLSDVKAMLAALSAA